MAIRPNLPSCTVCASNDVRPDPFFHSWKDKEYRMHRCDSCTHQFIWPSLAADEQSVIYGDGYFSDGGDWAVGHYEGKNYVDAEAHLRDEARQILAMLPVTSGRLLDIGCAGGYFLDEARLAGFEVAGVEFNPAMVAHATQRLHLDVRGGAIERVPMTAFGLGTFNVVVMNDCIEHLPSPRAASLRIRHWTTDDATLFIRGPLVNSATSRLKDAARRLPWHLLTAAMSEHFDKQLDGYPLDLNHFNPRSLSRLIGDQGFEVQSWVGATGGFANMVAQRVR